MNAGIRLALAVLLVLATLTPVLATELPALVTDLATPDSLWTRVAASAVRSLAFALSALLISGILGTVLGLVLMTLEGGLDAGAQPCEPGLGDRLSHWLGQALHALLDLVAIMPALVLAVLVFFLGRSLGLERAPLCLLTLTTVCLPSLSLRACVAARDAAHLPHLRAARLRGEGAARRLCIGLLPHALPALFAALVSRAGPLLALAASLSLFGLGLPAELPDLGVTIRHALWEGLKLEPGADWLQLMEASQRVTNWTSAQWQELLAPLLLLWALVAVFAALGRYLRRKAKV